MIEDEKETCTELIEVFEQQQEFGIIPISAVQSPIKSRDELPPIFAGIATYLCVTPELNAEVFRVFRGKGTEGEEKDGEIRDGFVAYPGLISRKIRVLDADYAGWMISPTIISLSGRFLG
ncbi:hypothetical protein B188_26230 [Candidatus Brocadiaceae bacterium B188]|nr:hypothetical protein [Candidatus Brocadia sapporoensis]QQR65856.1 MAG: hypothetical protein IPI25_09845 [Candidatus Brocadia sp.]RZV59644.1 MAG: hypothetical protein EX330_00250 [Candidatus Brocadia sp. BROELEC01]TWU50192.1 hypothetical protein B188_26230 [Candidatus Brocadiaceae bacterium B188]